MSHWFRWYQGCTEDVKFRVVAHNADVTVATVIGVWACLLEDASDISHRGIAIRPYTFDAIVLGITAEQIQKIVEWMIEVGIVDAVDDGIRILKWKERQFETDASDPTSAERQRRWRQKRKSNAGVTATNAASRPDTDTDTDTDTEREETLQVFKKKPSVSRSVAKATRPARDDKFEEFKKEYPKRKGANPWKPAQKKFQEAVRRGENPDRIISAVKAGVGFDADKIGTEFIPQAVVWLNQQRYADYSPAPTSSIPADIPPEQHDDYRKGWRPGMPTSKELLAQHRKHPDGEDIRNNESEGEGVVRKSEQIH